MLDPVPFPVIFLDPFGKGLAFIDFITFITFAFPLGKGFFFIAFGGIILLGQKPADTKCCQPVLSTQTHWTPLEPHYTPNIGTMSWVETKTNNNHEKQFQMENQHISCQKKHVNTHDHFSEKIEFDQTHFVLIFFVSVRYFFVSGCG